VAQRDTEQRGSKGKNKGKFEGLDWLQHLPSGTLIPVEALWAALGMTPPQGNVAPRHNLQAQGPTATRAAVPAAAAEPQIQPQSWRVLLWQVPAETRIGREELLEAVGRPRSWLYRHTQESAGEHRIPHRKLNNELVFVAGEIREWLKAEEEIVLAGPTDGDRTLRAVR
jgi:predicted DNA-binding transcriptional regulator AlpA